MLQLKRLEYFYLIRHKKSGKFYAGSKYAKKQFIHPDQFWNENWNGPGKAYFTTSKKIKKIVDEEGNSAFEVCVISSRPNNDAREFESCFLNTINAAIDLDWINYSNGSSNFRCDKFSEKAKKNISLAMTGKYKAPMAKEAKEKISMSLRGRQVTILTDDSKISKSQLLRLGKNWDKEFRDVYVNAILSNASAQLNLFLFNKQQNSIQNLALVLGASAKTIKRIINKFNLNNCLHS